VSEALGLLGNLRQAIREAATQGNGLDRLLRAQLQKERAAFEADAHSLEEELDRAGAEVETAFAAEKTRLESRHTLWCARINQASQQTLLRQIQPIDEDEGRRKYAVQSGLLQTGRTRDAELAKAKQALEQYQAALALEAGGLAGLTQRVHASLGVFRDLVPAAESGQPVAVASLPLVGNEPLELFRQQLAQMEQELQAFSRCARGADLKEGVTAFVEKRKPVFKGA